MAAELLNEGTLHLPAWPQSLMRQTVITQCQRQTDREKSTANSFKGHEEEEVKTYFKRKKKIAEPNVFVFPERKR